MIADCRGDVATAAVGLTELGLPCFPCSENKRPATPHGFKQAAFVGHDVLHLWKRYPSPLIGVPTGAISGFDVLDIDDRSGGGRWFSEHRRSLPMTKTHRTRSGGLHLFFRHHVGLRCSAGQIAPGVDVRGDGGYVIWWPAAGYPVLVEEPIATWPCWLLPRQTTAVAVRRQIPTTAGLSQLARFVAEASEGERNNVAFWAACRAGEMVASGFLSSDSAVALIAEAAARAGLPYPEAKRTAQSGVRATAGGHSHG